MSPQIVVGAEKGITFSSSIKISFTFQHNLLTSSSGIKFPFKNDQTLLNEMN